MQTDRRRRSNFNVQNYDSSHFMWIHTLRLAWSFYAALNFNQRHEKKCLPSYSTFSFNFSFFVSFFAIWRAMNPFAMHTQRINNLILHFNERKFLWLNRCIVNAKQLTSMSEFLNFFAQLWREYQILVFLLCLWASFYWIFIYFDGLSAKNQQFPRNGSWVFRVNKFLVTILDDLSCLIFIIKISTNWVLTKITVKFFLNYN